VKYAAVLAAVALAVFARSSRAQAPSFHKAPAETAQWLNPFAKQPEAAKPGAKLYAENCSPCHGAKADGTANIPALRKGPTQSALDGQVYWYITRGDARNGMPGWPSLSRNERWQIVTYLKSLPTGTAPPPPTAAENPAVDAGLESAPPPRAPFTDFRYEAPGKTHKITLKDLPAAFATESAHNGPRIVPRPADAWPKAPAGFKVQLFAEGLDNPRLIRTAPNGDLFIAESNPGDIKILRGLTADGRAQLISTFATGLNKPYGIRFYPPGPDPEFVYIGDTDAVLRFPYHNGDLKASAPAQSLVSLPAGFDHWTRDILFSPDGTKMFVSVGSASNVDDPDTTLREKNRAVILEFNPDGTGMRVYAYGLRNAGSGLAFNSITGEMWCSVNERDGLGDNLVPDYLTHVQPGGFYGWPWWYLGPHQDPRHRGKHPELKAKAIVPDVLLQPHNASLQFAFYDADRFPPEYRGDIFASQHGSWNRTVRAGYEVIRVPLHQTGHATGEYEDFLTGFVLPSGKVWGRPVGVTVAVDGALLITDDGSNSVWRITYAKP